jgi:hypothetical protein
MAFDANAYAATAKQLKESGLSDDLIRYGLQSAFPAGGDNGEWWQKALNFAQEQNTPKAMAEKLKIQNEFDRERMKAAAPYKLLFDIPGQITQAFTLPGQLAMEGANRISNTVMEGVRALPGPQVVARSAQYTPTSYFGRG